MFLKNHTKLIGPFLATISNLPTKLVHVETLWRVLKLQSAGFRITESPKITKICAEQYTAWMTISGLTLQQTKLHTCMEEHGRSTMCRRLFLGKLFRFSTRIYVSSPPRDHPVAVNHLQQLPQGEFSGDTSTETVYQTGKCRQYFPKKIWCLHVIDGQKKHQGNQKYDIKNKTKLSKCRFSHHALPRSQQRHSAADFIRRECARHMRRSGRRSSTGVCLDFSVDSLGVDQRSMGHLQCKWIRSIGHKKNEAVLTRYCDCF